MFKIYQVGGSVRDELLGIKSKDIDYTVVPNEDMITKYENVEEMFQVLVKYLTDNGYKIFLETPGCFTIRAKFPDNNPNKGLVADFVLSRKEIGYIPNTRTPIVKPGTLYDDLERRDFTLNALAKGEDGKIIDFFDGVWALENGLLITPLDPMTTMLDDPLRLLRAFRFYITKKFTITPRIWETCLSDKVIDKLEMVVSQERIREEVHKMMSFDTIGTLVLFGELRKLNPRLIDIIFGELPNH